jgi:uncharacterized protein
MDMEQMIIDLKTIPPDESKHLDLTLERGWWHSDGENDQIMGISDPITAGIDIYKAGDKFVLEGGMTGSVTIRCDRCLAAFENEVKTRFKLFLAQPSQQVIKAEIELLEEDMETEFINGDEINLDEIFKEQLYLSLPIKCLCREGCLGLCPQCGTDLNVQQCQCRKSQP